MKIKDVNVKSVHTMISSLKNVYNVSGIRIRYGWLGKKGGSQLEPKILEIYDKCMRHNITIEIRFLLSDAAIEVRGGLFGLERK